MTGPSAEGPVDRPDIVGFCPSCGVELGKVADGERHPVCRVMQSQLFALSVLRRVDVDYEADVTTQTRPGRPYEESAVDDWDWQ